MSGGEGTEPATPGVRALPMFPLSAVLLPGDLVPLHVFEPRYRAMVADCLEHEPHEFGVVLIARGSEVGGGDVRTDVGTVVRMEALSRSRDGRYALLVRGTSRIRVEEWLEDDPYPRARVRPLDDAVDAVDAVDADNGLDAAWDAARAAVRRVEALLSEMGDEEHSAPGQATTVDTAHHAGAEQASADVPWELCRRLPLGPLDRQRLLTVDHPAERLALLTELAGEMADDLLRLLAQG